MKKKAWKPPHVNQAYPSTDAMEMRQDRFHPEAFSRASFIVYEIQNGYLLRPEIRYTTELTELIYCKDIQELTNQILSTQAQLRLNLK